MARKQSAAPDEPEIKQTSPPGEREGHEKYSVETSAAINSSCEIILGGGGLAAENVSLRWLMNHLFSISEKDSRSASCLVLARTWGWKFEQNLALLSGECFFSAEGDGKTSPNTSLNNRMAGRWPPRQPSLRAIHQERSGHNSSPWLCQRCRWRECRQWRHCRRERHLH